MGIYVTVEMSTITAGLYQAAAVSTSLFLVRQPNLMRLQTVKTQSKM